MARPEVKGLDYFPFDVGFFQDKKVRLLRGQHGAEGIEVYQRILCKIYEDNGYYLLWDDKDDFSLLADETGYPEEKVRLIVSTLLSRSLLDGTLALRGNVLTSRSIQRRYFEAIRATKEKAAAEGRNTVVEEDICLLTEDDFKDLNRNKLWLSIGKTQPKSEKNGSKSENYDSKSEKNPAKKSKVNESKEEESKRDKSVLGAHAHAGTPIISSISNISANHLPAILFYCQDKTPNVYARHLENFNGDWELAQLFEKLGSAITVEEVYAVIDKAAVTYVEIKNADYPGWNLITLIKKRKQVMALETYKPKKTSAESNHDARRKLAEKIAEVEESGEND